MYINIEDIDVEKLRNDIINYYQSAMFIVSPLAMIDMQQAQNASDDWIIKKAVELKMNLNDYIKRRNK